MLADYFISYTAADGQWAEWIAWILEEKLKSTVIVQAWDFVPGSNFVLEMHKAAASASRTIAVLSPDYLRSTFAKPEWAAAFAQDSEGLHRKLVPVMVRDCTPDGLLIPIVHIKLMNLSEEVAEKALLQGLLGTRQKPAQAPAFPGGQSLDGKASKPFPGKARETESQSLGRLSMPRLKGTITDFDRTRFIKQFFTTIRQYFKEGSVELGKHAAVEAEFTEISATTFTAEVFINGKKTARCKIWFGEMFSENKICYYEGEDNFGNAFHEALSIAHDEYELYLSALMKMGFSKAEAVKKWDLNKLSPEEAAEYLWQRFIIKLI